MVDHLFDQQPVVRRHQDVHAGRPEVVHRPLVVIAVQRRGLCPAVGRRLRVEAQDLLAGPLVVALPALIGEDLRVFRVAPERHRGVAHAVDVCDGEGADPQLAQGAEEGGGELGLFRCAPAGPAHRVDDGVLDLVLAELDGQPVHDRRQRLQAAEVEHPVDLLVADELAHPPGVLLDGPLPVEVRNPELPSRLDVQQRAAGGQAEPGGEADERLAVAALAEQHRGLAVDAEVAEEAVLRLQGGRDVRQAARLFAHRDQLRHPRRELVDDGLPGRLVSLLAQVLGQAGAGRRGLEVQLAVVDAPWRVGIGQAGHADGVVGVHVAAAVPVRAGHFDQHPLRFEVQPVAGTDRLDLALHRLGAGAEFAVDVVEGLLLTSGQLPSSCVTRGPGARRSAPAKRTDAPAPGGAAPPSCGRPARTGRWTAGPRRRS